MSHAGHTTTNSSSTGSDMGGMGHTMTFSSWQAYKLDLLFTSYTITEKWQFALTWFAVASAVIFYHGVKAAICLLEHFIKVLHHQCEVESGQISSAECEKMIELKSTPPSTSRKSTQEDRSTLSKFHESLSVIHVNRPTGFVLLRMLHGFLSAVFYFMSLMLMLIAMTFNPSLLLALGVGYAVGDYLFFNCHVNDAMANPGKALCSGPLIKRMVAFWITHSTHELAIILLGILTFPMAIAITYGLIENTCSLYSQGLALASEGPFIGSWPTDWCDFDLEPTQIKGLKVSLGVFYGWLTTVAFFAILARYKQNIQDFFHKSHKYGPFHIQNGELIMASAVISLILFNLIYWYYLFLYMLDHGEMYTVWMTNSERRPYYFTTQVTGRILDVALGLLFLPVAKNSVLQHLLGISYDSAITYHKALGWYFVIVSIIHIATYIQSTQIKGAHRSIEGYLFNMPGSGRRQLHEGEDHGLDPIGGSSESGGHSMHIDSTQLWGIGNWMTVMGMYGAIFAFFPILFALPFIRKRFYNLFYFSHLFLNVSVVFLWLHAVSDFYYMLPAIGLYAYDLFTRLYFRFHPNKVTKITSEPMGLIRVEFDIKTLPGIRHYHAGQFIRICFPTINSYEWHPFSLCGPIDTTTGSILLNPRFDIESTHPRHQNWTRNICRQIQSGTPISLDGPFGAPFSFIPTNYDLVLCFVGGTGISSGLGVVQQLNNSNTTSSAAAAAVLSTHCTLIWSLFGHNTAADVTTLSLFDTLPIPISVIIHDTSITTNDNFAGHNESMSSTLKSLRYLPGRIPFADTIEDQIKLRKQELGAEVIHTATNKFKIGIFICGPKSFSVDARNISYEIGASYGNVHMDIHVDSFDL